jgi:hypothetical protein
MIVQSRLILLVGTMVSLWAGTRGSLAASYAPDLDRIILVVGQNVESVTNYIAKVGSFPGGIMSYTSTASVEGLSSPASYGAGLVHAQQFIDNPAYNNTVLQLGLYLNGDLDNIIAGARAANISAIGNWIKNARRPVYLRIGYEFDAPWNALAPDKYITAYRRIVDQMRNEGVTNVAFVWHSACSPTFGGHPISAWYPGDGYVDWAGISVFHQFDGTLGTVADIDNFCAFAKAKNKPLMIAESTPFGGMSDARWANWFKPCLELIRRHHIQMWCYINTDWDALPIFAGQGWGDSRIERNSYVQSNWLAMINAPEFLKRADDLMPRLHRNALNSWREAESMGLSGGALVPEPNASGNASVNLDSTGKSVTINSATAGMQFVLRYAANASGTLGLYINSQPRRTLPIAATGGDYRDLLVHAAIPAGAEVRFQFDAGDVAVKLDFVQFRSYDDSDGDGLPDDWEHWRFGSLVPGANSDPDNDGSANYSEFVADTNPVDRASALRIGRLVLNSGMPVVSFSSAPNRTSFVQQSADLTNWTFSPASMNPNGNFLSAVSPPADKMFFRLHIP